MSAREMDHAVVDSEFATRIADLRRKAATEAEDVAHVFEVVDLIVSGATLRQVAEHYKCTLDTVRADYQLGLSLLIDRSVDRSMALREEITARQRALIFANMVSARAGDKNAAAIVNRADALLASIWGLRSLRVEAPPRRGDPTIAAALEGYLTGLTDAQSH
jgi:hypothetical protein